MNKVFQINLGGTPFTIDDDAYEHLRAYLEALHKHFRGTEGYTEITSDIEARLAELFTESLGNRKIVTVDEVKNAIEVMGRPEEFGADPISEESKNSSKSKSKSFDFGDYRTGKRLFRDPESKVVGGVCSGISAYFGIPDPIWVRLLFAIVIVSGGLGLPIYIILWAIMPEAKTAGDRLAMRGEPINVDNITRIVREEFDNLSEKVTELSEEWGGKKKAAKKSPPRAKEDSSGEESGESKDGGGSESSVEDDHDNFGYNSARVADFHTAFEAPRSDWPESRRSGRSLFKQVFRLILIAIMILLVLWLSAVCFGIIVGAFVSFPYVGYIFPGQENLTILGMFNILFVIGLPVAAVVMALSKVVFRTRIVGALSWGLAGFWLLNLISMGMIGSQFGSQFVADADVKQEIDIQSFVTDTMRLNTYQFDKGNAVPLFDGDVELGDDLIRTDDIRVSLKVSKDEQWHLIRHTYSRGADYADAGRKAEEIISPVKMEAGMLSFPTAYELRNSPAYRGQSVRFELLVPEGQIVSFEPDFFDVRNYINLIDREQSPYREKGGVWRMEADGLSCISCTNEDEEQEDQRLGFSDFNDLLISGKMKITIDHGDEYHLRITGPPSQVEAIQVEQNEQQLRLAGPDSEGESPIRIFLSLPHLSKIKLSDTDDVRLRGFQQDKLSIHGTGDFEIKSYGDVNQMEVNLTNQCELDLRGTIQELTATLSDRARLDGDHAEISAAQVEKTDDVKVGLPEYTKLTF